MLSRRIHPPACAWKLWVGSRASWCDRERCARRKHEASAEERGKGEKRKERRECNESRGDKYTTTVADRAKTQTKIQKLFLESKTRPRIQKHFPESKTHPRIQKHFTESKKKSQNPKMFWILGSILDSWMCFWFLGLVLDSGTCF